MPPKLIFLDTETTGNEVKNDRLAQLAYKIDDEIFAEYFKPPLPISVKSMSITHITNEMVADKPIFKGGVHAQKLQSLLNEGVMVAHNALFDKAILEAEGLSVPRFIDTLRIARHLDSENVIPEYNLQFLRYYLKLEIPNIPDLPAHDARSDIAVLEALFERQKTKIIQEFGDAQAIEKMIQISSKPFLLNVFNFGKHKGRKIEEVLKTDKDYLEWLYKEKQKESSSQGTDPLQNDWLYTLSEYLK